MINIEALKLTDRQKNIFSILNEIAVLKHPSSINIVENTGLSFATVSRATRILEKVGVVKVVGKEKTEMGRRPEIFGLDPDYGYLLHFYASAEALKTYIMDFSGELLDWTVVDILEDITADDFAHLLRHSADKIAKANSLDYKKIIAASVALPGLVDAQNQRVTRIPSFKYLNNINLFKYTEQTLEMPVIINNEARMNALGASIHTFRDKKNLIYIYFSKHAGIGSGILVDGKLVAGQAGYAGEIGNIVTDSSCLEQEHHSEYEGRLEASAALGALYQRLKQLMQQGRAIWLKREMEEQGAKKLTLQLVEQAAEYDAEVREVFEETVRMWAVAIINLSAILDPEVIVLGGALQQSNVTTLRLVQKYISRALQYNVNIVLSETTEYQRFGGTYMLKGHVLSHMLPIDRL